MSRRKKFAWALSVALVAAAAPIAALAVNAASAEFKWPGILDYVRRYPWWAIVFITAATIVFLLVTPSNADEGSGSLYDMRGSKFYGPVGSPQMIEDPTNSPSRISTATAETDAIDGNRRTVALYWCSTFLENGDWESIAVEVIRESDQQALCVQLDERNLNLPDVAVIVIIASAAQFHIVKRDVFSKLRTAREKYSAVRILLCAVDWSDVAMSDEDGRRIFRTVGYSLDNARFLRCPTEENFRSRLTKHIRVALSVGADQTFLENAQDDVSGVEGD